MSPNVSNYTWVFDSDKFEDLYFIASNLWSFSKIKNEIRFEFTLCMI